MWKKEDGNSLTELKLKTSFFFFFNHKQPSCRFSIWFFFVCFFFQVRLTPTAARLSRQAGWRSAAAKTECTSGPSPCPAPTSGTKPSTPARAAARVRRPLDRNLGQKNKTKNKSKATSQQNKRMRSGGCQRWPTKAQFS